MNRGQLLLLRQSVIAFVDSCPVFCVSFGNNLGLAEADSPLEPYHFVPVRNRIVREKLVIDVTLTSFGIVYRRYFGILFVYSVSGDLEYYDPPVGIVVAVERHRHFRTRLDEHQPFYRPSPALNVNVPNNGRPDSIHSSVTE